MTSVAFDIPRRTASSPKNPEDEKQSLMEIAIVSACSRGVVGKQVYPQWGALDGGVTGVIVCAVRKVIPMARWWYSPHTNSPGRWPGSARKNTQTLGSFAAAKPPYVSVMKFYRVSIAYIFKVDLQYKILVLFIFLVDSGL